jgi:hypothetical protein
MGSPAVAVNASNCGVLAVGVANVTGAAPTVVRVGAEICDAAITKSVALVTDPRGVVTLMGADIAENVVELCVSAPKDGTTKVSDVGVTATTVAAV